MARRLGLWTLLVGLAWVVPVVGQQERALPPATETEIPGLVILPLDSPDLAAVSDVHRVLVVAQKPGVAPPLSLYRLDPQGQPQTPPQVIELPRPEKLDPRWHARVLGMTFHPQQPLLYVWQDLAAQPKALTRDADSADFDHLAIYDIGETKPELLVSLCRGEGYTLGTSAGALGIDRQGQRLFVPNLRRPGVKVAEAASVGTLPLGPDGLPSDETQRADPVPSDRATARKLLLARVATLKLALKKARSEGKSTSVRSLETKDATPFVGYPAGVGFVPVSEHVTLVGGPYGPVTWDEGNRRARFHSLYLQTFVYTPADHRMVGHPTLPCVYGSRLNAGVVYHVEHADGYITGRPQLVTTTGAMLTAPVVMAKRKQLALGTAGRILTLSLDDEGAIRPEQHTTAVTCTEGVSALAYSESFDRLYAAVRVAPLEKKK